MAEGSIGVKLKCIEIVNRLAWKMRREFAIVRDRIHENHNRRALKKMRVVGGGMKIREAAAVCQGSPAWCESSGTHAFQVGNLKFRLVVYDMLALMEIEGYAVTFA